MAPDQPLRWYQRGDVVVHTRRPEWGQGVVDQATKIQHAGQPAQRLVVKFDHHGRVTINTAIAPIAPPGDVVPTSTGQDPLVRATARALSSSEGVASPAYPMVDGSVLDLASLPETMTDRLTSLASRLRATLDSYRFGAEPHRGKHQPRSARALLDWAIAQSRLLDPLAEFSREQLAQAYELFARERDVHLARLVREAIKHEQRELLEQTYAQSRDAVARATLERLIR